MEPRIRVRFAPSPTGPLHIGGLRTALFNYLFAKKNNGDFILRIEDTDRARWVSGAEEYIIESLNWAGIPYDEGPGKEGACGPYRQSERSALYRKEIQRLIDQGRAYYAFDTQDALDTHRKNHEEKGKTFIYNWHNRLKLDNSLVLDPEEVKKRITSDSPYVIRYKMVDSAEESNEIKVTDLVRGKMTFDLNLLDDKILFKSDGMPTYHLANIVDDHHMGISHVIRGEEWLPSLPLHVSLYSAFGWDTPEFAHLPLILKPNGKGKLSKRDGEKMGFPVFPLSWGDAEGFREKGYFPETVVNFLAMLGWNPGTEEEFFTLSELAEVFSLDRIQLAGARFDIDKTKWYNHYYLQNKPNTEIAKSILATFPEIAEKRFKAPDYLPRVVSLLKERANFINDIPELGFYFFKAPTHFDPKAVSKQWKQETPQKMQHLIAYLEQIEDFTPTSLESSVKKWIEEQGYSFGAILAPLRLVLVGSLQGPHVFEIISLLGKDETVKRINYALTTLGVP